MGKSAKSSLHTALCRGLRPSFVLDAFRTLCSWTDRLGRSTLWKVVKDERIRAAKVGKAVRLSRRSIDSYMEKQSVIDGAD